VASSGMLFTSTDSTSFTDATNWLKFPSWLGSLFLHLGLIVLLFVFWKAPEPRGDFPGNGGDSFREVGIRMQGEESGGGPSLASAAPVQEESPPVETPPAEVIPAPSAVTMPQLAPPNPAIIIGAGGMPSLNASQLNSAQIDQLIKPTGSGSGQGTGSGTGLGDVPGGGGKGTSFIGIGATGKRFVYVIDRSSSMAQDQALQAAKLELLSSIQQLDESQQFQVIFYNQNVFTLDTRGGRFDVFRGTDAHRLRVTEQIRDITPSAGTDHLPAILEGLKFNPDVLFLLTDGAAESVLHPADMKQIQRHNRGGTIIHCIEFGRGSKSPYVESANFLVELAKQNQGRYVYRDTRSILMSRENP